MGLSSVIKSKRSLECWGQFPSLSGFVKGLVTSCDLQY